MLNHCKYILKWEKKKLTIRHRKWTIKNNNYQPSKIKMLNDKIKKIKIINPMMKLKMS
jgi:hypothetical protein